MLFQSAMFGGGVCSSISWILTRFPNQHGSREYPERTTEHGQATGKLYHMRLRVECTLFCYVHSWVLTHAVLVIGLYELLDPARDISGQMHTR
jgi:hypothetical protein